MSKGWGSLTVPIGLGAVRETVEQWVVGSTVHSIGGPVRGVRHRNALDCCSKYSIYS